MMHQTLLADLQKWGLDKLDENFTKRVTKFAKFGRIFFFMMREDKVMVMGTDSECQGRLGLGKNMIQVNKPAEIPELNGQGVCKIVGNSGFQLALTRDHRLFGWGTNHWNVLGLPNENSLWESADVFKPTLIKLNSSEGKLKVVDISSGYMFNIAVTKEGNVYEWGQQANCVKPSKNVFLSNIVQIECGGPSSIMALDRENRIYDGKGKRISFPHVSIKSMAAGSDDYNNFKLILTISGKIYIIDDNRFSTCHQLEACSSKKIAFCSMFFDQWLGQIVVQSTTGDIYILKYAEISYNPQHKHKKFSNNGNFVKSPGFVRVSDCFAMSSHVPFMLTFDRELAFKPDKKDEMNDIFYKLNTDLKTSFDYGRAVDLLEVAETLGGLFLVMASTLLLSIIDNSNCCKILQLCIKFKLDLVRDKVAEFVIKDFASQFEERAIQKILPKSFYV